MRALLAFAALLSGAPLAAESAAEWQPVTAETGQIRDVDGLEALAKDFPDSGSVHLRLLNARLGVGNMPGVIEVLRWLNLRGYSFSAVAREQIPTLVGERYAEEARALVASMPLVIENSQLVAEVPATAGLVESVLASGDGSSFIATSITANAIYTKLADASWNAIPIHRASDLSGIVSEPDGSMAWVASGNLDGSEEDEGSFTGLIDLNNGFSVPVYYAAPEGVTYSDLSIAEGGIIFASDPLAGGVYRLRLGSAPEELVAPGTFRSPQGSAVSADGSHLYISDYRYGLAMIDLADGSVARVGSDVPVILDGIDGLWRYGNELIAIQNGTSPMRISAFKLSEDGTRVTGVRILEQATRAGPSRWEAASQTEHSTTWRPVNGIGSSKASPHRTNQQSRRKSAYYPCLKLRIDTHTQEGSIFCNNNAVLSPSRALARSSSRE